MSSILEYFIEAELSLAAYANLSSGISGIPYVTALQNDGQGLSLSQAQTFASNWTVVDQYDGKVEQIFVDEFGQQQTFFNPTGLSVTVFEEVSTGNHYVAIRGTELSDLNDIFTDVIDIGIIGTAKYQEQYSALSTQVKKWLDDGTLQSGFTVAGHSLGGFLATNLAFEYSADVSHTYLYNAPGVKGVLGGDLLGKTLSVRSTH